MIPTHLLELVDTRPESAIRQLCLPGHANKAWQPTTHMMSSRPRTCPSSTLPALHSLQLSRFINLHNTIDLSIRMHMILARKHFFGIHVNSSDAEVVALRGRKTDLAAAVLGPFYLDVGNPAFIETLSDAGAHIFVVRVARPVLGVKLCFEIFTGSAKDVRYFPVKRERKCTDCQSH
jgi:hypothetical protein